MWLGFRYRVTVPLVESAQSPQVTPINKAAYGSGCLKDLVAGARNVRCMSFKIKVVREAKSRQQTAEKGKWSAQKR